MVGLARSSDRDELGVGGAQGIVGGRQDVVIGGGVRDGVRELNDEFVVYPGVPGSDEGNWFPLLVILEVPLVQSRTFEDRGAPEVPAWSKEGLVAFGAAGWC